MTVQKQLSCLLVTALAWVCVAATSVSQEPQPTHPTGERLGHPPQTFPIRKFYDTANLAPGKAGDLIRSQEFDEYDLPEGVLATRFLYHSRAASGQDVPVCCFHDGIPLRTQNFDPMAAQRPVHPAGRGYARSRNHVSLRQS